MKFRTRGMRQNGEAQRADRGAGDGGAGGIDLHVAVHDHVSKACHLVPRNFRVPVFEGAARALDGLADLASGMRIRSAGSLFASTTESGVYVVDAASLHEMEAGGRLRGRPWEADTAGSRQGG